MTMHSGLVDQADKFKKRVASQDTAAYKVVKRHQLVVGFPIDEGVLSFQELYDAAIVSPAYGIWDLKQPDQVDRNYLERYLRSPRALAFYTAKLRSTTARRRSLPRETFLSMPIPLPPLPEQRRIAAILDKADAVRHKRQQTLDLADQFLRSAFLDMFGDPVTNPKGWPVKKLGEIASITTGNTPSRKEPEYYGTAIEWIKSDNINTPSHFLTPATESLSMEGKGQGRTARAGATLMTCIAGSRSCIGNVALTDREVAFNQQINAIEPGESLDPDFLYMQLLLAQRLIQAASTDSMKGLVSKGRLARVRIPVPPLVSQKSFSAAFRAELDVVQRLEEGAASSALLFHLLVQRAFQEEL
jgi:type I restriction enzyme S subunit